MGTLVPIPWTYQESSCLDRTRPRRAGIISWHAPPPYRFIYVMANPHSSNSELFNGQSIMPSVSRSIGTSSITRAPSSLRPFTIKVLLDAFYDDTEQYPFVIDGMAVSSVELLGMVTNKTVSMDHCTFDLYDGTGAVNVIYWFEGAQDSKDAWSFSNGMYVRVVGRTTSMEQFFQIKAYIVRPINNFNDVTHHFIYCIYAHIDISRQARLQDRFRNILTFSKIYFQSCATQLTVTRSYSYPQRLGTWGESKAASQRSGCKPRCYHVLPIFS
ncbi:replication protein A 32 kDa subunit B-like isoform X3 [Hordeum vulgare subsp. vulgare]|uniref:replication protein A 32 kDa subunit B-like isoform X3 n=1 Tax=Hordeum vulgare subsp. vulgare TaxID=112509 RepID=UPI001D1A5422|nr:replication protein A 32 kDa subunit B-like isoform X3 [Hordeum vulgare subsp. vulgare]